MSAETAHGLDKLIERFGVTSTELTRVPLFNLLP